MIITKDKSYPSDIIVYDKFNENHLNISMSSPEDYVAMDLTLAQVQDLRDHLQKVIRDYLSYSED